MFRPLRLETCDHWRGERVRCSCQWCASGRWRSAAARGARVVESRPELRHLLQSRGEWL